MSLLNPYKKPFINSIYKSPMTGADIEAKSFEIIDKETPRNKYSPEEWNIVRRIIHSTSDFCFIDETRFSPTAIDAGVEALSKGCPIYTDSNMIRSGLSMPRLQRVNSSYNEDKIVCYVKDDGVASEAKEAKLPRAVFAVRKAKEMLNNGIAVFGNSPVGLMELTRLVIEEKIKPALIIGMPVGFVHVIESKAELMSLDIPYIVIAGRRGGSSLAISTVHALCCIVENRKKN